MAEAVGFVSYVFAVVNRADRFVGRALRHDSGNAAESTENLQAAAADLRRIADNLASGRIGIFGSLALLIRRYVEFVTESQVLLSQRRLDGTWTGEFFFENSLKATAANDKIGDREGRFYERRSRLMEELLLLIR